MSSHDYSNPAGVPVAKILRRNTTRHRAKKKSPDFWPWLAMRKRPRGLVAILIRDTNGAMAYQFPATFFPGPSRVPRAILEKEAADELLLADPSDDVEETWSPFAQADGQLRDDLFAGQGFVQVGMLADDSELRLERQ